MAISSPASAWNILYRGPLSGCNYDCSYCPFAKTVDSRATLAQDAEQLKRFVAWVGRQQTQVGVLFTPWGEGLIRRHYQDAMTTLSHLPHVYRVAIQTNLSCRLDWLRKANADKLALWCTFHPSQVSSEQFLQQCAQLDTLGIRYSVGTVGLKADIDAIERLRRCLPQHVYLWVNAYKRERPYYTPAERVRLTRIDPFFETNNVRHPSLGKACQAGETSFSVNGEGEMYRCHFIKQRIGNIYENDFAEALRPRTCTNATCGCHIGYVHLEELGQYDRYGTGLLERIPTNWPQV